MIETTEQTPPDICRLLPREQTSTTLNELINQHQDQDQDQKPTQQRSHQSKRHSSGFNKKSSFSFSNLLNLTLLILTLLACICGATLSNAHVLPNPEAAQASDSSASRLFKDHSIQTNNPYDQSASIGGINPDLSSPIQQPSNFIYPARDTSSVPFDKVGDEKSSSASNFNQIESQRLEELISHLSKRRDELTPRREAHSKRSVDQLVRAPTSHLGPVMKLYRHFQPKMVHPDYHLHQLKKREDLTKGEKIGFGFLIPILVLLSGVFAGLTIGYMSLDDTQLQVLMAQGTPSQKKKAEKIMLVRRDPHRLLTTLLIANMCTNETLPIIAEPAFGGGLQAVIGSIVLVIVFAELIPQSVCARFGLEVGAYMAWPTRITMWIFWPVAYPVSRVLHWTLGAHQGIIYRRGELKELVTMHAASGGRGGDLQRDTVMLVGGALDLQEKVVKEAMTPIEKVFMLPLTAKLDYPTLERIVRSGHSRIPVYHEIEVPVHAPRSGAETPSKRGLLGAFTRRASNKQDRSNSAQSLPDGMEASNPPTSGPNGFSSAEDEKAAASMNQSGVDNTTVSKIPGLEMVKRKKILGTLLVKSCVLLDPEDAVPVSALTLNALPTVPGDEPLLNVLNVFQEGRSHMAIVSPRPRSFGLSRSVADVGSKAKLNPALPLQKSGTLDTAAAAKAVKGLGHIDEEKAADQIDLERASSRSDSEGTKRGSIWRRFRRDDKHANEDIASSDESTTPPQVAEEEEAPRYSENSPDEGLPIGIITMEDVLEELLQEEIYDEYDKDGDHQNDFTSLSPPPSPGKEKVDSKVHREGTVDTNNAEIDGVDESGGEKKTVLQRLGIARKLSTRGFPFSSEPEEMKEIQPRNEGSDPPSARPNSLVGVDGSHQAEDYLNAKEVSSVSPNLSRPQTPSQSNVAFENPPSTNPLASPGLSSNRPVIIRTQAPGGQLSTSVVSEGYLRGRRPLMSGLGLNDGSSSGTETPPARSLTPSSNSQTRGNRFKSTPLNSGTVPTVRSGSRSQDPALEQALEAQAAAAGSSSAPINLKESQPSSSESDKLNSKEKVDH